MTAARLVHDFSHVEFLLSEANESKMAFTLESTEISTSLHVLEFGSFLLTTQFSHRLIFLQGFT